MDPEQLEIYRQHTGRSDSPTQQASEAFVICGRRSGKSVIAALIAVFICCFRDYSKILVPGENGVFMVLASDRRQARVIFNYITAFLQSPLLKGMVVEVLKESVVLSNGVTLEIHTSNFRAVRGPTIVGAVLDEVAFWPNLDSANPDVEVLNALRPGMSTVPGALLLSISSPYAKKGALYDAYREHYGKTSDVLVWKSASREMNPQLSRLTVAAAYVRDASAARAEYGGDFRNDIQSLFDLEAIERLVVPGRQELAPVKGVTYSAFVDPSGGRADSMVLAVSHVDKEKTRSVAILDCIREVVPPFSPETVTAEFADILKRYGVHEVEGDRYGAQWVEDAFEKRGVRYAPSERNRSGIYLEFLPMITSGQVELLDNRKLVNQLVDLERSTGRGADVIDHPRGNHDDVANAAAGALVRALGGGLVLSYAHMVVELEGKYGPEWREHVGEGDAPVEQQGQRLSAPTLEEILVDGKLRCPQCGSTCVVRRHVLYHCNSCSFEFAVPGAAGVPAFIGVPGKGQRRDALENMPQERKWRGR
jgi:hypothetical protein